MTADQAFDRVETIPAYDICTGDVITVDDAMAPKEVKSIDIQGPTIQVVFVDGTEKFTNNVTNVTLYMD